MSFIVITVIAQFLNSIVALVDKYLVTSKQVAKPLLYVFYTGILTIFAILIYALDPFVDLFREFYLPSIFNIEAPTVAIISAALSSAFFQLFALLYLFKALVNADASDVVPVIGSLSAFFTLIFSFFVFGQLLKPSFFFGFVFLVIGTLFISHFRFTKETFYQTVVAGFTFGAYAVSLKILFTLTSFDNGFFWFSLLTVILSFALLFSKDLRLNFTRHRKSKNVKKADTLIVASKVLAGIAGLMLIKAIEIGDVSIVQALGGLQFVFLFLIAIIIGPKTSRDLGENIERKDLYQKLISISIIFVGFVLLFI